MNVKDLIKSFNRSDNLFAREAVDDDIDNNETGFKVKEKPLKSTYRYLKKHISVVFSTSEKKNNKDNLSKTKENKHEAKKEAKNNTIKEANNEDKNEPKIKDKNEAKEEAKEEAQNIPKEEPKEKKVLKKKINRLGEKSWFTKQFELAVGKSVSVKNAPFSTLEKDIRWRKRNAKEWFLYHKYKEPPRPKNIPDIVWEGPRSACFCISPMDNCDCKGDIVLPPRDLPIGLYWKFKLRMHHMKLTKFCKKFGIDIPELPQKPFPQRLVERLKAKAVVLNKLAEMNLNFGPDFCLFRCHKFYNPLASLDSSYFKLRQSLYEEYYKPKPVIVLKQKPEHVPSISDEIIDGLYRSVATQAITDENCEFIIEEISHILFGRSNIFQDIEGTPYCISNYQEVVPKQSEPIVKKMKNLLSISGIKKRVSNLTSSLMSAIVDIVDIEDTGIPINVRATQDPPLDNHYESIIVPLKYKIVKVAKDEVCPCCKTYKELHTAENNEIESKVTDVEFPLLKTQNWLRNCGPLKSNLSGKRILPIKDNTFSETIQEVKHENVSKVKNINDSIKLLKRDLITDKTVKKYTLLEGNKDLCEMQSKSMLNVEETKMNEKTIKQGTGVLEGTGMENHQMNSLEIMDSIKPCCINNILKNLEKKLSIEIFLRNWLEDEVFRKVARYIHRKDKNWLPDIESGIDLNSSDAPNKKSKLIKSLKSLKSRIKINLDKFSEFIKKQKSSLKCFAKKRDPLKSKSRIASSLEDVKLKISKSFKKMNKAVSSFCKRHYKKSSMNIKQLMASLKKHSKKKNSLDSTGNKSADRPSDRCNNTLQNTPDKRDSKISETEVLCVQYSNNT